MAKLGGAGLDRELAASRCGFRAYLLYGPDVGLAQERAERLVRRVVDDPADPFNVGLFSEKDVLEDPVRLADELAAQSLLGGRRVVRVREAGDRLAPALAGRLPADDAAALLVVEAGELTARSALRKLFEDSEGAAAIACYADDAAALGKLIDTTLTAAGLTASSDARALLGAMLGADRRATRGELAKLVDYMGGPGTRVDVSDVEAVIADDGSQAVEALAYAALAGEVAQAVDLCRRLEAEGIAGVAMVRSVSRAVTRAMIVADRIARGTAPDDAIKVLRPPLFFKDAPRFRAVLRRHSVASLRRIQDQLWIAEKQAKSTGFPDTLVAAQLILRIAARPERRTH
ncbi:MAG: DNA polymerase III subunit delta [Alphaproteobacteria bacterium]